MARIPLPKFLTNFILKKREEKLKQKQAKEDKRAQIDLAKNTISQMLSNNEIGYVYDNIISKLQKKYLLPRQQFLVNWKNNKTDVNVSDNKKEVDVITKIMTNKQLLGIDTNFSKLSPKDIFNFNQTTSEQATSKIIYYLLDLLDKSFYYKIIDAAIGTTLEKDYKNQIYVFLEMMKKLEVQKTLKSPDVKGIEIKKLNEKYDNIKKYIKNFNEQINTEMERLGIKKTILLNANERLAPDVLNGEEYYNNVYFTDNFHRGEYNKIVKNYLKSTKFKDIDKKIPQVQEKMFNMYKKTNLDSNVDKDLYKYTFVTENKFSNIVSDLKENQINSQTYNLG